ncbi:hypothetical protein CN481_22085 [Bacillus sp. AFS006103]|nr:hypothetical protein CN481_22085 [Bacillus sp. AFS006103]
MEVDKKDALQSSMDRDVNNDQDFHAQIIEHLGEYKRKILNIFENGTYRYKDEDIENKHIL